MSKGKKSEGLTETEESLEDLLAEMEARDKKRETLESLPPEVILQARKMDAQGKFDRKVVKRTPSSFLHDTLELECGHTTSGYAVVDKTTQHCQECVERWMLRHVRRSPQKSRGKKKP